MRATSRNYILVGLLLAALGLAGCDSGPGVSSKCTLNYVEQEDGGKPLGARCSSDSECAFSECMKPGDNCNAVNAQFGFCTRGCSCNEDPESRIPDDRQDELECVIPSGSNQGCDLQGNQQARHVVPKCSSVDDCKALADGWNACRPPSSGGTRPICHAE